MIIMQNRIRLGSSEHFNYFSDPSCLQCLFSSQSKGAWKSVIQLAERCIALSKQPHLKLHFRLCRLIAMTKLRMYQVAFNDFTDIGNFDDAKYRYETYPDVYGNKRGTCSEV